MKRFSEQFNTKAKSVKLQAAEKRELRERLVSYMEYHPLPAELTAKSVTQEQSGSAQLFTEKFTHVSIPFAAIFKSSAVFAVLMLVVLPFMAERAVPGDTLYAIKVQFNEEVRSTLTFDSFQKVEWETERLNRRIAEARLLASEGRLTEEVEAEVAEAVKVHTANAQREIAELRTEDADAATIASIALDTTLEVQSTSLRGEGGSEPDEVAVANFEATPNLIATAIDESRVLADSQTASTTPPAYAKLTARVEQNTTRIYELLAALETIATDAEIAEVTRRADDINRAVAEATDLLPTDEIAARKALVVVLQRTQRLIVYMTELEVVQNVDIETLIPVIPTMEEKEVLVQTQTAELIDKVGQINLLLEDLEDEALAEKALSALLELGELSARMASSSDNYEAFKIYAADALMLADDTLAVLTQALVPELPESAAETATTTASTTEAAVDEVAASTSDSTIELEEDETTTTASSSEDAVVVSATTTDEVSTSSVDSQ